MNNNKLILGFAFILIFFQATVGFAQANYSFQSEHYAVTTGISDDFSRQTTEFLEGFYDLYSGYLHFDPENQPAKMQVRVFSERAEYDAYLENLIGESRESFVFLQYNNPEKNILLGYHTDKKETFDRKLIHHSFVQYIKTFIPNPPLWLQKGFAVYFENSTYDTTAEKVNFQPNYTWVDTLRKRLNEDPSLSDPEVVIPVNSLLYIDQNTAAGNLESFYAQTWGMIDFLIHSRDKNYNRLLWDSISALSATATLRENQQRIVARSFEWVDRDRLLKDFAEYIESLKTFPDLVSDGIEAYSSGRLEQSEASFQQAVTLKNDHYVPLYYLGLIYYNRSEYSMAEYYYLQAVKHNGHADLLYYALGVNAYADSRTDDSMFYLKQSVDASGSYSNRAADLIEEIESEAGNETANG